MKKLLLKHIILIITISLLISCNAYKDLPVNNLTIGMSIEQVKSVVKRKLVQVSSSIENNTTKQVFQVQKRIVRGGIARQQRYNIFFIDNKLVKYEKDSEKFSF
jgi:DNA-dependent RNA polymerase auxiliary subunit epsilon